MSSKWRRFEVLLPLQFNNARDVPAESLAEAVLEVVDRFGAASYETQKVVGRRVLKQSTTNQLTQAVCRTMLGY